MMAEEKRLEGVLLVLRLLLRRSLVALLGRLDASLLPLPLLLLLH